jgi:hypothetical protein
MKILNIGSSKKVSMREIIALAVALLLLLAVVVLANLGYLNVLDYWTAVGASLTIVSLGVLYWGFKTRISGIIRKPSRNTLEIKQPPVERKNESLSVTSDRKIILLPDINEIMKLSISEDFIDSIYEQARAQAVKLHQDAKLSAFVIQVFPYSKIGSLVNIYFDFYSKWADKISTFIVSEDNPEVTFSPPIRVNKKDKSVFVFDKLPWKESPHLLDFLCRVNEKRKPFHPALGTHYQLSVYSFDKDFPWRLCFDDDFNGTDFTYKWDGKGLDDKSIVES